MEQSALSIQSVVQLSGSASEKVDTGYQLEQRASINSSFWNNI